METSDYRAPGAPAQARPAPDPALTAADILKAAQDLVPLLRERAVAADRDRRIEPDTYRRLGDAGLFHVLKPRRYGGLELSEHEHAKVAMTLARGCASTAWVFSILSSDNMAVLAYPERVQEEIWGTDTYATLAGNTNLNPKASAVRVAGGYRLTGQWGFCSGSDFSEWLIFNAPAGDASEGHMFLVPREDTVTIDDWFPTGMRGTGSRTMAVRDVFVPGHRVQATRDTVRKLQERRALHPTFDTMYAHWPSYGRFTFASTAVGAAWGAAEHFAATVTSATRVANALGGAVRLADQDYVAAEFAEAAGEVQMAMALIERRSFEASELARQRRTPSAADLAVQQRDNALVTRVALRSVQRLYSLVGAKAGNPEHPLSLANRDIEMVSRHVTLNWRQSAVQYLAAAAARARPAGLSTYHELVSQQRGASRNGKLPATAAERILSAAMREFSKYGFAGARVERIVSRADVSPRSLYYHFGSKRGLYDAVRERLSSQHFEDFVRGVTDEPLVDRLLANIDVAMTPRWQTWARLLMWEALDGSAGGAPYPEGTVPGDLLAIRAAQERGEISPDLDPHVLTLSFIAITFWPTMFPQSTKRLTEGMPRDELLRARKELLRALVEGLGEHARLPALAPGGEQPG